MNPTNALEALAFLAECALVGRVLLSLLPPGLPGRHAIRDLPATWAASHVLGSLALPLEERTFHLLGLSPSLAVLLAPWLLVMLARWITLPGATVPRHESPPGNPVPIARAIVVASTLGVIVAASVFRGPAVGGSEILLRLADALALLALSSFALSAARRKPLARAIVLAALAALLIAAIVTSHTEPFPLALCMGAGSALGVSWIRRGDRRAAAFAALAFAGTAGFGPREALYGLAGLFALWIHTAMPSRRFFAVLAIAAFVPAASLGWLGRSPDLDLGSILSPTDAVILLVVAFALEKRERLVAGRDRDAEPSRVEGAIDSPKSQSGALRDMVILCILPLITRVGFDSLELLAVAFLPLAPLVAIEFGLLLSPAEIPGNDVQHAEFAGVGR